MKLEGQDIFVAVAAAFAGGLIMGGHIVQEMRDQAFPTVSVAEAPAEHSIPGAVWIGTVPHYSAE